MMNLESIKRSLAYWGPRQYIKEFYCFLLFRIPLIPNMSINSPAQKSAEYAGVGGKFIVVIIATIPISTKTIPRIKRA